MTAFKTLQDVVPAGKYAIVRDSSVTGLSASSMISAAQAAGLNGLVFVVGDDSAGDPIQWKPSASSTRGWQQVQAMLAQSSYVAQLNAAGLIALTYLKIGSLGIQSHVAAAKMAKYCQDVIGCAGTVLDLTDNTWNNDIGWHYQGNNATSCIPQCAGAGMNNLCRMVEQQTKAYHPIFLMIPKEASTRPASKGGAAYWTAFTNDTAIRRTMLMPVLATNQMEQVDYLSSYSSYQVALQAQLQPRLEFCLNLAGANPTEVSNILGLFSTNGAITLPVYSWTPVVGLVLLDDLTKLTNIQGMSDVVQVSPATSYWDYDIADNNFPAAIRFATFDLELPDPLPVPIVGQQFTMDLSGWHSMRGPSSGVAHVFFSLNPGPGTPGLDPSGTAWFTINGQTVNTTILAFPPITLSGTPRGTLPTILLASPEFGNQGGGATNVFIPLAAANAGTAGRLPGQVTGASVYPSSSRAPGAEVPAWGPMVSGTLSGSNYGSSTRFAPPWAKAPGGTTPVFGPGGGYLTGTTTTFQGCIETWSVDNGLLNTLYSMLSGQLGGSFSLGAWAFFICLIQHESGWLPDNVHCDTAASGSQGLWQIEITGESCPGNGPVGSAYMAANPTSRYTILADPTNNTQSAISDKGLKDLCDYVNANGGFVVGNEQVIKDAFWCLSSASTGTQHPWCATPPALQDFDCVYSFVTGLTWPLAIPATTGHYGAPSICGSITCNYDNGARPHTCGPNGTYAGHDGVDFSCTSGASYQIDHSDPNPANWTAISGGPDSSTVYAVAAGTIQDVALDPASNFNVNGIWTCGPAANNNPSGTGIGWYIVLVPDDNPNLRFRYCHFNERADISVTAGQHVIEGQIIAPGMGARGCASGTHLHFEAQVQSPPDSGNWVNVDPTTLISW